MPPVRFDQWMHAALYGPRGYYTSDRIKLGWRGDFTTTPKLSLSLAKKLSTLIEGPVIELGPGDGSLAAGIRECLNPRERRRLRYFFVETSPFLREAQRLRVSRKGRWFQRLQDALKTTGPHATIISNEFFDAFPVRIFQGQQELYLENGQELWQDVDDMPDSHVFERDWPTGQRLEVLESVARWYADELTGWHRGQMISIDYGGTTSEIYHRRPHGTLRAYFHHQRLSPPEVYARPGHQDLTTDVNFDDLQRWGKQVGLKTVSYQSQADFLGTDPEGPDGAFRVLIQART